MRTTFKLGMALTAALLVSSSVIAHEQTVNVPFESANDGRIYIDATMNGKRVHALLDTGANMAAVTPDVGVVNAQFMVANTRDFAGDSMATRQGTVKVCLTDDKDSCADVDGVTNARVSSNLLPVSVLEGKWKHVELDFKTKTLTLSN